MDSFVFPEVEMTVAASPNTRVFVYRNMVKALPWFTSVREKLTDPAYAPWFMNFSAAIIADHKLAHVPVCDTNYDPPLCSHLYHDQARCKASLAVIVRLNLIRHGTLSCSTVYLTPERQFCPPTWLSLALGCSVSQSAG